MSRYMFAWVLVFVTLPNAWAQAPSQISVAQDGWTIVADSERGVLSVSHDKLGILMKDLRLHLRGDEGLTLLKSWSAEKRGDRQLSIQVSQPPTAWSFDVGPNILKISSTATNAVLTANVPATMDRVVARLLDPEGVPVDWEGTAEVQHTYGGSKTWNQSYLPRRNPECMYLALGPVAGSNLHSLFDRKTDTGISFPEQALLQRDPQGSDLLDATIPVPGNALVRLVPDYYTKALGVPFYIPFDDSYFRKAPLVWCSWTSYYGEVREEDIVRNTDWLAENLKPYGIEYVQLDDGYDRGENGRHYWIEKWDQTKFPHGPQWLTNYIKSKGLRPGLWIVPNAYAGAFEEHPDWYLYDKQGKVILDYRTPTLDSTNPQVLDFLKKEFSTLRDWGFEYYKFDGEHAVPKYAPTVDLSRLYDKSIDPIVAYRNRLKLIRETVGPKTFIEGCPAGTPLNGIGYFNSYFNGEDVYNNWLGMYALFSSINANAFLNHMVVYVMPGEGIEVGPRMSIEEASKKRYPSVVRIARSREGRLAGLGTTLPEARTLVSYVSLTGVVYSLSSVMPDLPEERVQLLKKTMPTLPILPVDLFSRGTDMRWDRFKNAQADFYIHNYPEILDLKVNAKSGVYDVVGLTNWRSETARRTLSFADKLGLRPDSSYVVFDFWAQKPLGVFKGQMSVEIEPHDTRVFMIHPLQNHPQLIGTSRHISGALSILNLAWDSSRNTLSGSSQTVPGDDYTLWVHVPEGLAVARVQAATKENREVPTRHEVAGDSMTLSFQGRQEPVNWEIEFAPRDGR
jgi:hypothetical protein